ncbi:unnamed protein product [Heterobilharzia americana]|nr:unnamed protein product [Heterobilharzia americana]
MQKWPKATTSSQQIIKKLMYNLAERNILFSDLDSRLFKNFATISPLELTFMSNLFFKTVYVCSVCCLNFKLFSLNVDEYPFHMSICRSMSKSLKTESFMQISVMMDSELAVESKMRISLYLGLVSWMYLLPSEGCSHQDSNSGPIASNS